MKNIYVYGTVFNSKNTISRCINSLNKLGVKKIYVTDNFSTDGTYEELKRYKNVVVIRRKSSRGKGREIAKTEMLKHIKLDDAVFVMDFDTELTQAGINYILKTIKHLKNKCFYGIGFLGNAYTHSLVEWHDLMLGDDVDFMAQAISKKIKIIKSSVKEPMIIDISGLNGKSIKEREYRYVTNPIRRSIRFFRMLVDAERGNAFSSPIEFFLESIRKKEKKSIKSENKVILTLIFLYIYLHLY